MNLADILVAGHLSRHSLDSTSSVSMMIKALRWGYKQLQIQALVVAFGSFTQLVPNFFRPTPCGFRQVVQQLSKPAANEINY